ncbi:carotenoid oxygenase family protein [Cyanobium sp. LEGE 06113]|uniref:carotenoid oxygenase family protein n=1 Tax=Cyanobium sp. LEGE 06113 TaxID=1297573 RepID=UPI00187E95D4|nr:carotenoid oxygenase family protein [Cyanobium sp. LEGE 06113]MBE9154414.1 carotenoid oxygenase family protein [Cyanobium sp. LEGE 06113]
MTIAPSRSPAPSGATWQRADWASSFRNVGTELADVAVTASRGTIPAELCGSLYRNGPGRLERGGQWVHHPFDGDGMITALRFEGGEARLSNRFVRTEGWQAEESAGRFVYRGVFGTQKPGGALANAFDLRLKNIANTHVVRLGDQLLALWEAAEPHALDPNSLETRGLSRLDGVLKPGEAFSAHPRFDPGHRGAPRMVTFGVKSGPRSTIRLMEFATADDPAAGVQAGQLLAERHDTMAGFAFLHDFAITPNWAVFLQNAMAFNPLPYVLGQKGAAQCLASKPGEIGRFFLVPRPGSAAAERHAKPLEVPAPEGFVFHHLNAFEDEATGELVLDSIFYADFPSIGPGDDFRSVDFEAIPEGQLKRCRIDLERAATDPAGAVSSDWLEQRCCEFATVHPARQGREARFAWMAVTEQERGNAPLQAIEKLDLSSGERRVWCAGARSFVSEPVMVPRAVTGSEAASGPEDDGWLLCVVWNGARCASDLVILNAHDLSEQAVLELPLAIPHGLHGSWVAA